MTCQLINQIKSVEELYEDFECYIDVADQIIEKHCNTHF